MSSFSIHRRDGTLVATFTGWEAGLLRSLAAQLVELLDIDTGEVSSADPLAELAQSLGPAAAPDDPVLARLLPDAYSDDPDASSDFRRFTENELRSAKAAGAAAIISDLEDAGLTTPVQQGVYIDVELAPDRAMEWMKTLTNLRLALAVRLGIADEPAPEQEERWLEAGADDPAAEVFQIYQWLAFLQESLVEALME